MRPAAEERQTCWRSAEYGRIVDHPCFLHTFPSEACIASPFMEWVNSIPVLRHLFDRATRPTVSQRDQP